MTYIQKSYLEKAWETEMRHHERTISQLRFKIERLTKEISWELEQHHSRLQELDLLESPLSKETTLGRERTSELPSKKGSTKIVTRRGKRPHIAEPALVG
jgi:hypothetical protein